MNGCGHIVPAAASGRLTVTVDVDIRDGGGESPLGLALWTDQFPVAQQLIDTGAHIEATSANATGLLYLAIVREKAKAARYLLDNGADFKKRYLCVRR